MKASTVVKFFKVFIMGILKSFIGGMREAQAELIDWQNAVMHDKSHKLYASKQQLEVATAQIVSDSIRIFDDSSNIINTTVKPDIFFSRLDLAKEHLARLKIIEPYIGRVKAIQVNIPISDLYAEFNKSEDAYIETFLQRSLQAVHEKADSMKTEKGKGNQYKKYYESMQPFLYKLNSKNREYLEQVTHLIK